MNMKKIIISLFILFFLTGCFNYKELNDYAIVTGVAIDKKDGKYEVSTLISNAPKSSTDNTSSESQIVVYSGTGKSVFEAFKDIGLTTPKELYLNSFSILVLSEETARDGLNNVIDFFLRYSSSRNKFFVIISKNNKAKDILKITTHLTNFPSQGITDNIKSTTHLQGIINNISFDELTSTILRSGVNPVINSITIEGNIKSGSSTENLETSSPKAYVKLGNLAIFKEDKLVDWASKEESLGINTINNKIEERYLDVDYKDGYVVVDTTSFKTDIKVSVKNNKPIVNINLSGEGKIYEVKGDINLKYNNVIKELEDKCNKLIISNVKKAIKLAIKNKTDIFGFGLRFYQNYPKFYEKVKDNWEDNLENIEINVKSNLILKNKVSSKNSLEVTHEK